MGGGATDVRGGARFVAKTGTLGQPHHHDDRRDEGREQAMGGVMEEETRAVVPSSHSLGLVKLSRSRSHLHSWVCKLTLHRTGPTLNPFTTLNTLQKTTQNINKPRQSIHSSSL